MERKHVDLGALPGVRGPGLTREPLGTRGELTPGPDELDPDIPEQRVELVERGYVQPDDATDELSDFGVADDADWGRVGRRGMDAFTPDRRDLRERGRGPLGLTPLFE